jgi:hypothetical protein
MLVIPWKHKFNVLRFESLRKTLGTSILLSFSPCKVILRFVSLLDRLSILGRLMALMAEKHNAKEISFNCFTPCGKLATLVKKFSLIVVYELICKSRDFMGYLLQICLKFELKKVFESMAIRFIFEKDLKNLLIFINHDIFF